jgi:predicted enzyme related to lactoylglutathione lyase
MKIAHAFVQLATDDVPRLYGFYKDVVELPIREGMGPDSFALATDTTLAIIEHSKVHGRTKEPERVIIDFWVDDIEAEHERLRERGVGFIREKGFETWGGLISTFNDPDGNTLQIIQYRPELAQAPEDALATA